MYKIMHQILGKYRLSKLKSMVILYKTVYKIKTYIYFFQFLNFRGIQSSERPFLQAFRLQYEHTPIIFLS